MSIGKDVFAQGIVIRLFRRWSACRTSGQNDLPAMIAITEPLRLSDQVALSCSSLFELIEGHLGRPLVAECCCAQASSADEKALSALLSLAPSVSSLHGNSTIPHGLPDVLCWSVIVVRHAFGLPDAGHEAANLQPFADCPFEPVTPLRGASHGL